jgi:hypothetical protein
MKSRSAKIEIFGWAKQWALAIGIAFLLVASPQASAVVACLCEPQLECEESCCQKAHRSDTTAEMQGESPSSETSTSCETSMQATGGAQSSFQSPPATVCCVEQPQSEPPTRFVSLAPQLGSGLTQFADILLWSTKPGPAHTFNPICRCSRRPLYLAFSRLLI